jgi:hypothetical protein
VAVHDLDIFGIAAAPAKTDAESIVYKIVYADAQLPGAIAFQRFESVPRWGVQIMDAAGEVKLFEFA